MSLHQALTLSDICVRRDVLGNGKPSLEGLGSALPGTVRARSTKQCARATELDVGPGHSRTLTPAAVNVTAESLWLSSNSGSLAGL